jgi:hypothetical protein
MALDYIPVKEVVALARQGYNDETIIRKLREQGFTPRQINDAFNQVKIKAAATSERMEPSIMTPSASPAAPATPAPPAGETEEMAPPAPSPSQGYGGEEYGAEETMDTGMGEEYAYPQYVQYPTYEARPSTEVIEEIAEEIINEKWRDFKMKAGDFGMLTKHFEQKLKSLSARMRKIENYMDKIQGSVVMRVRSYESQLKSLRAEIYALETAFSKILEPLVTNVRHFQKGAAGRELRRIKKKQRDEEKLESKLSRRKK